MFQSATGRHSPSLSSAPLLLPSNYPCQSGFHIQSIIWCPLVLPRSSVRKPTTSITHNAGRQRVLITPLNTAARTNLERGGSAAQSPRWIRRKIATYETIDITIAEH